MMSSAVFAQVLYRWMALAMVLFTASVLAAGQTAGPPPPPGASQTARPGTSIPSALQPNSPMVVEPPLASTRLSLRQKDAIVKANFKSTQRDVAKLSRLVQNLDQEMKKSNPNILSVGIVKQAEKIEKLAKKIRNEAKSY